MYTYIYIYIYIYIERERESRFRFLARILSAAEASHRSLRDQ